MNHPDDRSGDAAFIQSGDRPVTTRTKQHDIFTFQDFGVDINGGQDDYAAVLNCIEAARRAKLLIKLPFGGGYLRVFPRLEPDSFSH